MKIRMLTTQCGPDGQISAGSVVDVEPIWGRDMINGGHAEEVIAEEAVSAAAAATADKDGSEKTG